MRMAVDVDRGQVLAYRVAAHELERAAGPPCELAVLDLGVQDTPYGSARLALAARTETPRRTCAGGPTCRAWPPRCGRAATPTRQPDRQLADQRGRTARAGGVRLEPGSSPTAGPIDGWPGVPSVSEGTESLVTTYLRLLGPATVAEAAKFLGATQAKLWRVWPDGLAKVRMDRRRAWLPEDRLDALVSAPPRLVRLLPPSDPLLQARDRVEDEAGHIAAARGARDVRVRFDDSPT